MAKSTLISKIHINCPLCNMLHEVEERARMTSTTIKGETVFYEEHFYLCKNIHTESTDTGKNISDENLDTNKNVNSQNTNIPHEFQTESLTNNNLMAARNAYRKIHNLLTSDEIIAVRENYGLTQVEAAKLFGWGEATIARYESKAIQDEAYDTMLRNIQENPLMAIAFLDKNGDKFPESKRMQIRTKMIEKLDSYGKEYLARQIFAAEYVKFSVPSDFNGYRLLDLDKLENIVSYYAAQITDLYKIQLMNMLWYADALFFKTYSNSMTGLAYRHESMGALPVGHNNLIRLKNINVQTTEDYESTQYHFYPNAALDTSVLARNEISILDTVIAKFRNYNTSLMVAYMQEETAYKQTNQGDLIPYGLAGKIRAL